MLLDTVDEYERIFEEPVSKVIFNSFGDNSLNLQLRCFVGNVDNRMSTTSKINETVNQKFNAVVISITFPQRDVHLDIKQPIDVCLQNESK